MKVCFVVYKYIITSLRILAVDGVQSVISISFYLMSQFRELILMPQKKTRKIMRSMTVMEMEIKKKLSCYNDKKFQQYLLILL